MQRLKLPEVVRLVAVSQWWPLRLSRSQSRPLTPHRISSVDKSLQESTMSAANSIRRIHDRMQVINEYTAEFASSIEEQNTVTADISSNVTAAAERTHDVSQMLTDVANDAMETETSGQKIQGVQRHRPRIARIATRCRSLSDRCCATRFSLNGRVHGGRGQ